MNPQLDPKKILLIDDDNDFVESAKMVLEANFPGKEIICAFNGNKAAEEFRKNMPAVVILDMMLPGRSGFLVLEEVIRTGGGRTKGPFVIMITGNTGKRHQMYAESLGVRDYLVKPFKLEKLCESVQKGFIALGIK